MTPERWQQVAEAFEAALELDAEQRRAFLSQLHASLSSEVEALLAEDAVQAKTSASPIGAATLTGRRIGGYQIVRVIGEGGMGVVFEAEQQHPRRIVALKVIKPGFATAELVRRFEQESQVLARLQHPGIAQIYEAGAADTGFGPQPYFAMELIHGEPLRQYAESHQLNTRQRLDLIAKVCDAVEHAHQRGIIHRDLKPGNILVDETGQPKVLDFGVARVTDGDVQATRQTDVGQLIGTLAYMSPEQVTADPLELDTRSDVYALGVILYELLAKRLPYQLSQQLHEAVRAIREEDPTRLSSVSRAYRGDVETIVAKALEKDKGRRYTSPAALAADLRRYLADEPILARPASTSYQLRKFARRHKALVMATTAVFAVLVAGVIVSTTEAVKARRAEQTAQAVNDFLQNDLLAQASASTQASPNTKPDPDLKVRTALDRAAAKIGSKFKGQPEVEAAIRDTIGQTYLDLGLYAEARAELQRSLEIRRRVLGADTPASLKTMNRLGWTAFMQGRFPEAETLLRQALNAQRRLLGPEHANTLDSMNTLGSIYYGEGKYAEAEALHSQTLQIQRRVLGPERFDTLASMINLANAYDGQGKYAQAEAVESQALEILRRVLGPEHPQTLLCMNNLANAYFAQGKYAQAESLHSQVLEIHRRVLGPEHLATLRSSMNLANAYTAEGEYARAESLYSQTLEIQRRVLGQEHPSTLITMNNLADAEEFERKYAEAEMLFGKALEISRRVLGPEHAITIAILSGWADSYLRQGRYALAETRAAQAVAAGTHGLGADNPETIESTTDLVLALISQGKFAESESLGRHILELGRKTQANEWQRFRAESILGAALAGQKKYAEAEPLLVEGYQGMTARKERMGVPDWYHLDRAHDWLVQLYQAWGKPDKAAEWRKQKS